MIASSAHAKAKTQRVNKFSVKGNKHQTPLTRNSDYPADNGMVWHGLEQM